MEFPRLWYLVIAYLIRRWRNKPRGRHERRRHKRRDMPGRHDDDPDPIPVRPVRVEIRRDFPVHGDLIRPLLTLAQARRRAANRLDDWRRDHGIR